jgi:hypothetical protein
MCIEDMDCPDVIFFHKSGRYIVLNSCGNQHPGIPPIVERGNWLVRNKKELILKNRDFVSGGNPSFRETYGKDAVLSFSVKQISDKALLLDFYQNGKKYTDHYQKVELKSAIMQRFFDNGSCAKTLAYPSSYVAVYLLKLEYKLFYPRATESGPSELVVEDQDGHELWRKTIIFKQEKAVEDILLGDRPEVIDLKKLVFKIKTKNNVYWELKVKLYG